MFAALTETLGMLAQAAARAAEPWWIIGSTAVALHGGAVARVKDVDLMMSPGDAEEFLRRVGVQPRRGSGDERFRSAVFGVWTQPPLAVEAFGGFELLSGGAWRPVALSTRQAVTVGGAQLFVPSRDELVRLLKSFGRPKDLERSRLLDF